MLRRRLEHWNMWGKTLKKCFAIKPTPTCLSRRLSLLSCCSHRKRSQWDSHSRFALLFTFFSRLESGKYLIFFHILPLTRWKKINRFLKVVSVELQCLREREVIDRALQPDSNFLVEFFKEEIFFARLFRLVKVKPWKFYRRKKSEQWKK